MCYDLIYKKSQFMTVLSINIEGLHQLDTIEKIGKRFNSHSLVLEDIANTEQHPKMEDFDDYIFLILKMLCFEGDKNVIKAEQVDLIYGESTQFSPGPDN